MNLLQHHADPRSWAENHFAGAAMSDTRRRDRVVTIAEAMAASPGKSIPQMFASTYDVKATYELFKHPEATPDNLQAGHRDLVKEQLHEPGVYLLIEDTTEMSWSGKQAIAGLGSISNGKAGLQGFHLHSVLAVRWPKAAAAEIERQRLPVALIGLAHQKYYVRQQRAKGTPKPSSQAVKKRARESQRWEEASYVIGQAPTDVRYVRVADREADIYEYLLSCQQLHHGYVIRAYKDRALQSSVTGKREGQLFEEAQKTEGLGGFSLKLRSRPKQPARTAHLQVSATEVLISSPWRPGRSPGKQPPIACTLVRVWEVDPEPGVEAIEWLLLCDGAVTDFEEARERAWQYATRWLIEEYHKALKSGLRAEALQLERAERLMAAIAIKSVVALRLIDLKERLRFEAEAEAAQSGLDEVELSVLRARSGRSIRTVKEVALAIGKLGGHLNRKADGMPGWQTLWRGMEKLGFLVEGVHLARKLT
jgi:hypothetical protein